MPAAFRLGSAFAVLLALAGCSEGRIHRALGAILAVRGNVACELHGRSGASRALTANSLIGPGDSIQVPHGSELDMTLVPGLLLRVTGDSQLVIEDLVLIKDGNETGGGMIGRSARLRFNRGKATVSFQLPEQGTGQITVETAVVSLDSNSSTLFSLEANSRSTRLMTVTGQVETKQAGAQPITIDSEAVRVWDQSPATSAGGKPALPSPAQLDDARAIEKELLEYDPPETFRVR